MEKIICPYCNNEAPWVENKEMYGRNYGKSYMCYYCKPCEAYVGCHNNTRRPLGTMANRELRQWRRQVHDAIDPLWKSKSISRGYMYHLISEALGYQYHTGESDIETCKKILSLVPHLFNLPPDTSTSSKEDK
jgi:hypothetical protein